MMTWRLALLCGLAGLVAGAAGAWWVTGVHYKRELAELREAQAVAQSEATSAALAAAAKWQAEAQRLLRADQQRAERVISDAVAVSAGIANVVSDLEGVQDAQYWDHPVSDDVVRLLDGALAAAARGGGAAFAAREPRDAPAGR